jgi:hypothetical protein
MGGYRSQAGTRPTDLSTPTQLIESGWLAEPLTSRSILLPIWVTNYLGLL